MSASLTLPGLTGHIFQVRMFTRYELLSVCLQPRRKDGALFPKVVLWCMCKPSYNRAHDQAALVQHSSPQSVVLRPEVSTALRTGTFSGAKGVGMTPTQGLLNQKLVWGNCNLYLI